MPKRLIQQRRGKGTSTFRAPSFRFKCKTKYRSFDTLENTDKIQGAVIDIFNDPARSTPIMLVKYTNGELVTLPAPFGIKVGDTVEAGTNANISVGSVLPLKNIPTGTDIYNIELVPGDGGKIVKAAGGSAKVVGREAGEIMIRLPSKEFKKFNINCRATIGIAAGSGRKEKPITKAGKNWYITKARGKYWPRVAGVAMNAVCHPFGGKRRSTQKSKKKSASRNAPPGRKVGSLAPKRTGRTKR